MHDLQPHLPELYRLSIAGLMKVELIAIRAATDDLRPGALR